MRCSPKKTTNRTQNLAILIYRNEFVCLFNCLFICLFFCFVHRGTAEIEIQPLCAENPEISKVLSLKPGLSWVRTELCKLRLPPENLCHEFIVCLHCSCNCIFPPVLFQYEVTLVMNSESKWYLWLGEVHLAFAASGGPFPRVRRFFFSLGKCVLCSSSLFFLWWRSDRVHHF